MLMLCPDPELVGFYENLPVLPYVCGYQFLYRLLIYLYFLFFLSHVCEVKSFSGYSELPCTRWAEKCGDLPQKTIKYVIPDPLLIFEGSSNTSSLPG